METLSGSLPNFWLGVPFISMDGVVARDEVAMLMPTLKDSAEVTKASIIATDGTTVFL